VAISNEALEWQDRAEQAREVAGKRSHSLRIRSTGARAAIARIAARKRELVTKSEDSTHDFSRPSLIPTEGAPR
jgi:hypothetical protein